MGSTYCSLLYHAVFSTKDRKRWLDDRVRQKVYAYMGGTVREKGGVLIAANGTEDHVHLLLGLHQTKAIADSVKEVKANSSRWIHDTFPEYRDFAWQRGYGAFTVSYSQQERVEKYLARQHAHHRKSTFQEEFIELLERHRVEYDPRYVWD